MGIEDRDYWRERNKNSKKKPDKRSDYYDPKALRGSKARNSTLNTSLKNILIWLVIFAAAMFFFNRYGNHHRASYTPFNSTRQQPIENVKPIQVEGDGFLELGRTKNAYYVAGSVNGFPVVYQVDTGAGITSISQQTAGLAGITTCTSQIFDTANGPTTGCVATIPEIGFGNFHVRNVSVAIMPNMKGALLGMNVLSHFGLEQHGNVMRILPQQ